MQVAIYFVALISFYTIRSEELKGHSSKIGSLGVYVFICRSEPSSAEKAHEDSMLQQEIKAKTERERSETDILCVHVVPCCSIPLLVNYNRKVIC